MDMPPFGIVNIPIISLFVNMPAFLPLPVKFRVHAFFIALSVSLFLATSVLVAGGSSAFALAAFVAIWLIGALAISPLLLLSLLILIRTSIDALSDKAIVTLWNNATISASQAFGAFTLALAVAFFALYKKPPDRLPLLTPFLLFLAWGSLTILYSVDASFTTGTGYEIMRLATIIFIFFLAATAVRTASDWHRLLVALTLSSVLPLVFAAVQFFSNVGYRDEAFAAPRIFGTFVHPNVFATFFVAIAAIAFLLFEEARSRKWKVVAAIFGILSLLAILLSFTRIAWLAVALLAFLLLARKSIRWIPALLTVGLIAYAFVTPIQERVNEAFTFSSVSSLAWRFNTWNDAIAFTRENGHIFLGSGLNTFSTVLERIRGVQFTVNDPHSEFIRAFVEGGIVGLFITLAFYAKILSTLFRSWKNTLISPEGRSAFFILFALWISLTVASLTDHILRSTPLQWVVWSLMGGAFAVFLPKKEEENEDKKTA